MATIKPNPHCIVLSHVDLLLKQMFLPKEAHPALKCNFLQSKDLASDFVSYGKGKQCWDCITDLPDRMPSNSIEWPPIWKGLHSSTFTRRHFSCFCWMYMSFTPTMLRPAYNRKTWPVQVKPIDTSMNITSPRFHCIVSANDCVPMNSTCMNRWRPCIWRR